MKGIILKTLAITLWSIVFIKTKAKEFSGKVIYENTEVYFNAKHITDHQVRINPGNTSLHITFNITKPYKEDPWMAAVLLQRNRNTNRFRSLLKFDNNMCSLMGVRSTNLLSTFIQKFSNLGKGPSACPPVKGNYSWPGVSTDSLHVPPLFKGKYRVNVITYFPRKSLKYILSNVTVFLKVV